MGLLAREVMKLLGSPSETPKELPEALDSNAEQQQWDRTQIGLREGGPTLRSSFSINVRGFRISSNI